MTTSPNKWTGRLCSTPLSSLKWQKYGATCSTPVCLLIRSARGPANCLHSPVKRQAQKKKTAALRQVDQQLRPQQQRQQQTEERTSSSCVSVCTCRTGKPESGMRVDDSSCRLVRQASMQGERQQMAEHTHPAPMSRGSGGVEAGG